MNNEALQEKFSPLTADCCLARAAFVVKRRPKHDRNWMDALFFASNVSLAHSGFRCVILETDILCSDKELDTIFQRLWRSKSGGTHVVK